VTDVGVLTDDELDKLGKLLGMLGSDFAGERAAAGAKAAQLVRSKGLTWSDVLKPQVPAVQPEWSAHRRPWSSGSWRDLARLCLELGEERCLLNDWETSFLRNIAQRWRQPTTKQAEILGRIALKVGAVP
jgi:hypothetical protein